MGTRKRVIFIDFEGSGRGLEGSGGSNLRPGVRRGASGPQYGLGTDQGERGLGSKMS